MDCPSHPTPNPLEYTFDGHFLPDTPDDDCPRSSESGSESELESESESRYSNSSFRLIANVMVRMEVAQLEMMKKREIARLEAQRRQAELEHEMTRMMLQTQAHIASIVCHSHGHSSSTKKRKSSNIDHHSTTSTSGTSMHSDRALLLSLLLSNTI